MLVRRLRAARRDVVDVHVEGARRSRVQREALDPALLERLAQGHLLAGRLARIAVAARLQPAIELAVVEQEHLPSVGRDRDRAAGQVPLADRAVERPLVASHEATIWSRSPASSASAGASSSSERTRAVRGSSRSEVNTPILAAAGLAAVVRATAFC